MKSLVIVLAASALCGGCASNQTAVVEHTFHKDGTPASDFTFRQQSVVTWGSRQELGTGDMSYEGPDWMLEAGSAATNQQAGDGVDALRALLDAVSLIAPYLQRPAEPQAPPESLEAIQ